MVDFENDSCPINNVVNWGKSIDYYNCNNILVPSILRDDEQKL